ncbi:MAG TPA: NAD(P)-binding domain-containing protein [bacterium]|nr:NAD(P)-binding domain-containing protein [bacterium]
MRWRSSIHASAGSMIAILSTVSPRTCREVAAGAGKCSIEVNDTPMAQGTLSAEEENLLFMVDGESRVVERCRPDFPCPSPPW